MPDRFPRDWIDMLRSHAAWTMLGGFLIGLAALPAIGFGHAWIGLGFILVSRAVAFAVAGRDERGAALDLIFFASLPFAFALADPSRALAATFLLFGFVAAAVSPRASRMVDGIICTLAFAAACAFPPAFSLIAYGLGLTSFAAAGVRIAGERGGV